MAAPAGDDDIWVGSGSGAWDDAANWEDTTTGTDPAAAPPGALDSATFLSGSVQTITGTGTAASVLFEGDEDIAGTLSLGAVTATVSEPYTTATLRILAGGTIAATSFNISNQTYGPGDAAISGAGASLQVSGLLTDGGGFAVTDGGQVQAAALLLDGVYGQVLSVDSFSSVEIGTLGNAALGALTVDDGATLTVNGNTTYFDAYLNAISAAVVDNGVIAADTSLTFASGNLSGIGLVEIAAGQNVSLDDVAATGDLSFDLAAQAALTLGEAGSGVTIHFEGPFGALNLVNYATETVIDGYTDYEETVGAQATVEGFNSTDVINLAAIVNGATYQAGANSLSGSLILSEDGATVTTLSLEGDYSADRFVAVQSGGLDQTEIVMLPLASGTISPGTETGDQFLWVGPASGNWNDAANWEDLSAQADPAAVAPGTLDSATITNDARDEQVIGGSGAAATLALNGDNLIAGGLSVGTLELSYNSFNQETTDIADGGTIIAQSAIGSVYGGADVAVSGTGSLLGVTGEMVGNAMGLTAADGGAIQLGTLLAGGELSVDATSRIEIGTLGGGALGAITVDEGATLAVGPGQYYESDQFNGSLIDDGLITSGTSLLFNGSLLTGTGTVAVQGFGNYVSFSGSLGGDLALQLGTETSVELGLAGSGDAISLSGNNQLVLTPLDTLTAQGYYEQAPIAVSAAISGFDGSDLILFDNTQADGVTYVPGTSLDTGNLVMTEDGAAVTTLTLDGNYTGDQFFALQTNFDQIEVILIPPNPAGTVSAGTPNGAAFDWIGPVNGDWNNAANWYSYGNSDTIAPGGLDSVYIASGKIVDGTGDAASGELNGILAGTFSIGTVTVDGYDTLSVIAGGTLSAGNLQDNGNIGVIGAGSSLEVKGALVVDGGYDDENLDISGGANVQAASLISSGYIETITFDTLSSIEIGTLGVAAAGELTVDPNATLSVPQSGSPYGNPQLSIDGSVQDNGVILAAASVAFNGASLSGNGVFSIASGGAVTDDAVTSGNVQFLLGADASLDITEAGGGVGISLGGAGDILTIGEPFYGALGTPPPSPDMQAVISGFGGTDVIYVDDFTDSASYAASAGGLVLSEAGTVTGTLTLAGDFSGETFAAVQLGNDELQIIGYAAAPAAISPGSGEGDSFLWTNSFAGAWNDAANWEDLSAGSPAAIAPGVGDSVTFAGGEDFYQVIGGSGVAASASFSGENAVTGTLNLSTLALTPNAALDVSGGGQITAGSVSLEGTDSIRVAGPGAALSIGGGIDLTGFGSELVAGSGGAVQASALTLAGGDANILVDGLSSIEIGTLGGGVAGALTVDDGATLLAAYNGFDGSNSIDGNVVDNGTIIAGNGLFLNGNLSGTGTVLAQAGAFVASYGSVSGDLRFYLGNDAELDLAASGPDVGITLSGSGDALGLGMFSRYATNYGPQSLSVQATVSGFNASDALFVAGVATSVTAEAGPQTGTSDLRFSDGTAALGTLALTGAYAGDNFLVVPITGYYDTKTEIVILPGSITDAAGTVSVSIAAGQSLDLDILDHDTSLAPGGYIQTLLLDGPGTGEITSLDAETLDVAGGATLQLDNAYQIYGQVKISAGGEMTGYGYLWETVQNDGTVAATGGVLEITDSIGGTGELVIGAGAVLRADGGLGVGQNVSFGGAGGEFVLNGGFTGGIAGFAAGDTIQLENLSANSASFVSGSGLELGGMTLDLAGTYTTGDFTISTDGTNTTIVSESAPCYCAGTRILTPRGNVPVEALRIGDSVITFDGTARAIKWIGRRAYDGRFIAGQHLKLPVCIRRNAIGENIPSRDLWVSPGHAIFAGGRLVPAWRLLNGVSIIQAERVDRVEYFHIELNRHAVIFAENCPAESFFDDDCRGQFQNAGEFSLLYGAVRPGRGLKRTESGVALERLRRQLARRAGLPLHPVRRTTPMRGCLDLDGPHLVAGWAQNIAFPEAPVRLDICQGDRVVARVLANEYRADLRKAGLGSGCHGFAWRIPRGLRGPFEVCRSVDGAVLPPSAPERARAAFG